MIKSYRQSLGMLILMVWILIDFRLICFFQINSDFVLSIHPVVKCCLIASPGFVKDQFYQYLIEIAVKNDMKIILDNRNKFILCHSSTGFKHSLKEVLADPLLQNRLADTKAAKEMKILQDFQRMLANDSSRAFYGRRHIEHAIEAQAIETLLISDRLFRYKDVSIRRKYIEIVDKVRQLGGNVHIFSSLHVSGEREYFCFFPGKFSFSCPKKCIRFLGKFLNFEIFFVLFFENLELDQFTGIAAILRFPIAEIDDDELDDEEDEEDEQQEEFGDNKLQKDDDDDDDDQGDDDDQS